MSKEITDHNKKSGNSKRSWKYYEGMEECIGGNSSVHPLYTLESSSTPGPSDNISSSSDDENQGITTSAAEMLDFLKDHQQHREEAENKKVRILQEINEDKKTFWASLLEVMKTAKK